MKRGLNAPLTYLRLTRLLVNVLPLGLLEPTSLTVIIPKLLIPYYSITQRNKNKKSTTSEDKNRPKQGRLANNRALIVRPTQERQKIPF